MDKIRLAFIVGSKDNGFLGLEIPFFYIRVRSWGNVFRVEANSNPYLDNLKAIILVLVITKVYRLFNFWKWGFSKRE